MLSPRFTFALALSLAAPLAACGNGGGGSGGAGGDQAAVCSADPRATVYAVGLEQAAMDGAIQITFMDAQPAPPSKGDNAWTIKVTDKNGAAMTGATITLLPFMPDHGHGSSQTPVVTPMGSDGTYQVTNVSLFMAGIWQFTFTVTPPSGPAESVVFTFCVDG